MNEKISSAGLKLAYAYLDSSPKKNIPKLMNWIDRLDKNNSVLDKRLAVRKVIENKDNNWYRLILGIWEDVDPGVKKTFFQKLYH